MGLREILKKFDEGEKDFMLVALAFILVFLFILINGSILDNLSRNDIPTQYTFGNVDMEGLEMTEIQVAACMYAEEYGTCDKIESTSLVTEEICCAKRGECCG